MSIVFRITSKVLLPAACASALLLPASVPAVDMGSVVPAFELQGRGEIVKLANYRGKWVYVDFWASWCGPCKQSFPWMNEIQSKYGSKGLQVIGISVDTKAEDARKFLLSNPANFTIAFDESGATPRSYNIKGMPSSVLIGPDGKIIFEHVGFNQAEKAEVESKIKLALKEK